MNNRDTLGTPYQKEIIKKFWLTCPPSHIGRKLGLSAHEIVSMGMSMGLGKRVLGRKTKGWQDETPRQIKPWSKLLLNGKLRFEDAKTVTRLVLRPKVKCDL